MVVHAIRVLVGGAVIPLTLVTHGVAAAIAFAAAWVYQSNAKDAAISNLNEAQAKAMFRALETAHGQTIAMQEHKDAAIRKAEKRAAENARSTELALNALRVSDDAASSAIAAAKTNHAACVANATTLGSVYGKCTKTLVELGERATGHVSDIQMMQDSWPRYEIMPQGHAQPTP